MTRKTLILVHLFHSMLKIHSGTAEYSPSVVYLMRIGISVTTFGEKSWVFPQKEFVKFVILKFLKICLLGQFSTLKTFLSSELQDSAWGVKHMYWFGSQIRFETRSRLSLSLGLEFQKTRNSSQSAAIRHTSDQYALQTPRSLRWYPLLSSQEINYTFAALKCWRLLG